MTEAGEGAFSIRNTFVIASVPVVSEQPVMVDQSKSHITVSWEVADNGGSVVTGFLLFQTNVTTGGVFVVYDGRNIPTVTSHRVTQVVAGH